MNEWINGDYDDKGGGCEDLKFNQLVRTIVYLCVYLHTSTFRTLPYLLKLTLSK